MHLISKMRPTKDGGSRFGIVLNGSPLFTGNAGSGESEIRRYIATDDPEICVARVRHRVAVGGHDVPEDKIAERYRRSLAQLYSAIRHTNRAFIFDNSATTVEQQKWIAEVTEGRHLELKVTEVPAWFQEAVLERVSRLS